MGTDSYAEDRAPLQAPLIVEAPLPESLAKGLVVVVRYQTENLRTLPIFGPAALDVAPQIEHLHITLDDAPWQSIARPSRLKSRTGPSPCIPRHDILSAIQRMAESAIQRMAGHWESGSIAA
jgi:hypothetical protein